MQDELAARALKSRESLRAWLDMALAFVRTLPPKERKPTGADR